MSDSKPEPPYLISLEFVWVYEYNPKFGDARVCACGHTYYRHFDSYDNKKAIGCKYCECDKFEICPDEKLSHCPSAPKPESEDINLGF